MIQNASPGEHHQHHHPHVCHAVAPPLCQRSSPFQLSSSSSSSSSLPPTTLPNLVVVDRFPNHRVPSHLDLPLTNIVATTSVFSAFESSLPVLETSDNEQTSYTLDSATPLERRSSACHRPRSSIAWFSLVRRRCSNICGKLHSFFLSSFIIPWSFFLEEIVTHVVLFAPRRDRLAAEDVLVPRHRRRAVPRQFSVRAQLSTTQPQGYWQSVRQQSSAR